MATPAYPTSTIWSTSQAKLLHGSKSPRQAQPSPSTDLAFSNWLARELEGRAADGRRVRLSIAPSTANAAPLDIAIAVDHSGSMGERCAIGETEITKHQAVVAILKKLGGQLGTGDRVDLWQFDSVVNRIGSTRDQYD